MPIVGASCAWRLPNEISMPHGHGLPPPNIWEKFSRFRDKHKVGLRCEYWYPLALGIGSLVATLFVQIGQAQFDKLMNDAAPIAISVAAIFAGFQGAIQAILLSMVKSRVIKQLKEADLFDPLIGYVRDGTMTLIIFVAAAMLVVLLRSFGIGIVHQKLIAGILVGLFVYSIAASVRIVLIMMRLIRTAA
jgi:hypothetical protein